MEMQPLQSTEARFSTLAPICQSLPGSSSGLASLFRRCGQGGMATSTLKYNFLYRVHKMQYF